MNMSKFNEIMREQLPNLNVYEQQGIMAAQVNQTNLLLREYHANPHPVRERQTKEGNCKS